MIIPASCNHWIEKQRTRKINFEVEMENEYDTIRAHLPGKINNVIDIGCGIGGIDVFLSKNHGRPSIYMLDYDKEDTAIHYGLQKEGSKYNSLEATREFLDANYVYNYKLCDAAKGWPAGVKFDLIISLLSCGYHYPLEKYLPNILADMTADGILIIDVRQGSRDLALAKTAFGSVEIICDANKAYRILARRTA